MANLVAEIPHCIMRIGGYPLFKHTNYDNSYLKNWNSEKQEKKEKVKADCSFKKN